MQANFVFALQHCTGNFQDLTVLMCGVLQGEGAAAWKGSKLIVAEDLVPQLSEKFGVSLQLLASFKGAELEGTRYRHPLFDRSSPVVVGGDYITTESGTGLVHTAPGHGQEDYLVSNWISFKVEITVCYFELNC